MREKGKLTILVVLCFGLAAWAVVFGIRVSAQTGEKVLCNDPGEKHGKVLRTSVETVRIHWWEKDHFYVAVHHEFSPEYKAKLEARAEAKREKEEELRRKCEEAERRRQEKEVRFGKVKDAIVVDYGFTIVGGDTWAKQRPGLPFVVEWAVGNRGGEPIEGIRVCLTVDKDVVEAASPPESQDILKHGWACPVIVPGQRNAFLGWSNKIEHGIFLQIKPTAKSGQQTEIGLKFEIEGRVLNVSKRLKVYVE